MRLLHVFLLPGLLVVANHSSFHAPSKDFALQGRARAGTRLNQAESFTQLQRRGKETVNEQPNSRLEAPGRATAGAGQKEEPALQGTSKKKWKTSLYPFGGLDQAPVGASQRGDMSFSLAEPSSGRRRILPLGKKRDNSRTPTSPHVEGMRHPPSLVERMAMSASLMGIGGVAGVAMTAGVTPTVLAGSAVAAMCVGTCALARLHNQARLATSKGEDHPNPQGPGQGSSSGRLLGSVKRITPTRFKECKKAND